MAISFSNIPKSLPNGENMGGITQKVYYGLWSDVETWPTIPSSPTTLATNAALTGDITMTSGTGFFELYITDDTGEFKCEMVGETDGKSFVEHLTFIHPGLSKTVLGFMNATKNENMVFIVEDNNGTRFLMGDENRPATLAGGDGATTGKATSERRGISMEFTYKTKNVYTYEGSIPLASGASA